MPVEIKELIIRATITEGSEEDDSKPDDAGSVEKEELISACVEQVLEILERSKER